MAGMMETGNLNAVMIEAAKVRSGGRVAVRDRRETKLAAGVTKVVSGLCKK